MIIFIVIVKYLYIFVFRNPLALLSEFWCNFININALFASVLTQTVFILLPGKNPVGFYICCGIDPRANTPIHELIDFFLYGIGALLICLYLFLFLRIKLLSKQTIHANSPTPIFIIGKFCRQPPIELNKEKNNMANEVTIGLLILSLTPIAIGHTIIPLEFSLEELSTSPNIWLIHFLRHGSRFLCNLLTLLVLMSNSKTMRATLVSEVKDQLSILQEKLNIG